MMRTSTGSIRVMKMAQKQKLRPGKWKNTMAKAANSEMMILPPDMPSAMMSEFFTITNAEAPRLVAPSIIARV